MFPLFRVRWLSTRLGILLVSNIVLPMVLGQNSSGRYDVLHGSRGQDACRLQNNIVSSEKCSNSSLSPVLNAPVPSQCTCNTIFFNIWSACVYSTGNNTLPNFTQWTQSCVTSFVDVESSMGFSEVRGNLGIRVPSWAKLAVPGNTTFDLQKAVTIANSASKSSRWTTLQIILPIAAAVATLLISGGVLLIYQRCQRKFPRRDGMGWPKGLKRLHLRTRVVTTIDRDESWEIDGPNSKQPSQDVHGQPVSTRKSFLDLEPTVVDESDNTSKTVRTATSAMGKHSFRMPIRSSARLPWKRKPPSIKFVPATSRFRVDDSKSIFTSSGEAVERDEFNAQELVEDLDHVSLGDEETASLITASERATRDSRDVILISRGGRQFTLESRSENTTSVNSHIKIISPSVSSESPHSTMQPVTPKPTLYAPIPPPPPSYAAPAPPVMPRSLKQKDRAGGSNREHSLAYFRPPSFLTPIREGSPMQSSHGSLSRSSAIRRPSLPRGITSQQISNPNTSSASSLSSYGTVPLDTESEEDDVYMEATATNGHDHRPPDSNASNSSFYYDPPVQGPVPMHPLRIISLDSANNPTSFSPGAVRGAGYSRDRDRTYNR